MCEYHRFKKSRARERALKTYNTLSLLSLLSKLARNLNHSRWWPAQATCEIHAALPPFEASFALQNPSLIFRHHKAIQVAMLKAKSLCVSQTMLLPYQT